MTAAATLLKEVGKPRNAHVIDIDELRTLQRWLAADDTTRVKVVTELADALDKIRRSKAWAEFRHSGWNIHRRFNDMIAVARVLDRLIRAKLPLAEKPLLQLVRFAVERNDFSVLRLLAQLEYFAKSTLISDELRAALGELDARHASERFSKIRARIGWLKNR